MARTMPTKAKGTRLSLKLNRKGEDTSNVPDWSSITDNVLIDLVHVITGLGGAVRFGFTRDGGAYSVGIYLDDDRETFYCKPNDDLDRFVIELTELLRE